MATVDVSRVAPRALKWGYRALFLLGICVFLGLLAAGGARGDGRLRRDPNYRVVVSAA